MSRTVHIAISESAGCSCHGRSHSPSHDATAGRARGLGDPGDGPPTAKLEDPGDGPATAKLEDPGDGPSTAKLENPEPNARRGRWDLGRRDSGHSPCDCDDVAWHCAPITCGDSAGAQTDRQNTQQNGNRALGPLEYSGFIILRLAAGLVGTNSPDTLWDLANQPGLAGLKAALRTDNLEDEPPSASERTTPPAVAHEHLRSRPLIDLQGLPRCSTSLSATRTAIEEMETRAANTDFPPLHSLTSYWRIDARHLPARADELTARFNGLPEVDLAYRELLATDAGTSSPALDSYADTQDYLDEAPIGVGARWALTQLDPAGKSTPRKLVDIEQGWIYKHQELAGKVSSQPLAGENRHGKLAYLAHHGTAVLGQLCAGGINLESLLEDNATIATASHFKGEGQSTGAYLFANTNGHVAEAIFASLDTGLGAGDVLLLEVQRARLPTEADFADLYAIRLATALGVTVVEAAGNHGVSLDEYRDERGSHRFERGSADFVDSGALVVGAAEPELQHDRASFSNYGSRLDCYGWGRTVISCGYGDLDAGAATPNAPDINQFYTNTFNGTSSASPIIAGTAFLLLCLYQQKGCPGSSDEVWLSPLRVRALLSDPSTGTAQGPGVFGRIGVMPDLRAILQDRLALLASPVMRKFVGEEWRQGEGGPVSASPDIVVAPLNSALDWGQGGGRENHPSPGGVIDLNNPVDLIVRMRNRGLEEADDVRADLYCSEAATLLTPELWQTIGSSSLPFHLPPGDELTAAPAIVWNPANYSANTVQQPPQAFALMAIFTNGEKPPPPPPSAPYFDWNTFLRFQRSRHVACRNVHWVQLPSTGPLDLHFMVTGAPDRSRTFDFELIRRLPPEVKIDFAAPKGLVARLHQRRPWIAKQGPGTSGQPYLKLPSERRLAFRRIQLPKAARLCSSLSLTTLANAKTGQSLAIRQLYRGEEVGRITWLFKA